MSEEQSLKQKAYQYIKSKIVDCEYPPDSFVNEKQLMAEVGVSRTPIREALSKLEQENLVAILPNRGVAVRGLAANEINMMFQARELIEPHIVRTDGSSIDRAALADLKRRMADDGRERSTAELYALDDEFHKALTRACRNTYFLQVLDHMYIQLHRLQILNGKRNAKRLSRSFEEHLAIIDLLLSNDFDGAAEADRLHLAASRRAALDLILNS